MQKLSMRNDIALLLDILTAADDTMRFTADLDLEAFLTSRLHQNAVIRLIEVIGEAAGKVSKAFCDNHPEIPWRYITGMRHRLIHGYADVRYDIGWDVVRNRLPDLTALLRPLVPPE
jgi:uncharacterized protein with HEPN domain